MKTFGYPLLYGCLIYLFGSLFFAMQAPEKYIPGKCDRCDGSHNIMHVCVVIASVLHYTWLQDRNDRRGIDGDRWGRGGGGGRGFGGADARTEISEQEADVAIQQALNAVEAGLSVLLITPYRRQRGILEDKLQQHYTLKDASCEGRLVLSTVDGAQGQESDVLIISLVKRQPSRFLDKRRLCVMLSRARQQVIFVGDRGSHVGCRCAPLKDMVRIAAGEHHMNNDEQGRW